jgi:hypothetical protein
MKHQMKLKLSDAQLKKLACGEGVMIHPKHVCETGHPIALLKRTADTIRSKHAKGKSHILKMTPSEMKMNKISIVEGGRIRWGAIGRTVGKATKKALEYYRQNIRPVIGPSLRKIVKDTAEKVLPKIAETAIGAVAGPETAMLAKPFIERAGQKYAEPITEGVSKLTGAYGIHKGSTKQFTHGKTLPEGHQQLQSNVEANQYYHEMPIMCPHCKKTTGGALFLAKRGGALFL